MVSLACFGNRRLFLSEELVPRHGLQRLLVDRLDQSGVCLFTVYPERLASPNPFFTLFLLVRLTMLWSVFLAVKNASRLPQAKDRINIFLPFRQRTERGAEG